MGKGILSGLRIVECADLITGPFCTKLMADLGAEVIKIEEPTVGDKARRMPPFLEDVSHPDRSGLFLYLNTNKLGITLNLENVTAKVIFQQLVEQADILVENTSPHRMEGLGLGYDVLKTVNPRLIMTSITSFGQTGPYKNHKPCDLVSFHMGGMASVTPDWVADPDREPPLKGGGRQADFTTGLTAALITMAAMHGQYSTGLGQHIDVSEQEVVASALARVFVLQSSGAMGRKRGDGPNMERPLPCKDGYIEFHCVESHHWKALMKVMDHPEWGDSELFQDYYARCRNWKTLEPLLAQWTRKRTRDEIYHAMQAERVAFSPVNTTKDLLESAQLLVRGFFVAISHPEAGELDYPGTPYRFSGAPSSPDVPSPLLGQHNEKILCSRLAYTRQEVEEMKRDGII
ncbi:MAG: CoA transferase [Thermodesulfobacteriota bacterium]|nr:CoA transferase [Thermodesulfobacteriota bacterium]